MIYLRPHHITSYLKYCHEKKYELSENEFVDDFNSRNIKMAHGREFILRWRGFMEDMRKSGARVECRDGEDVVCENCDIREKCLKRGSELYEIVERLDRRAKSELTPLPLDE